MMASRTASMIDSSDPDGSTGTYLGPGPPAGKGSDGTSTQPGIVANAPFRVHGPQPPLFTKAWQ